MDKAVSTGKMPVPQDGRVTSFIHGQDARATLKPNTVAKQFGFPSTQTGRGKLYK